MSRAMGSLLPYISWKLLIMHVGVGGPFATFSFLTKVKTPLKTTHVRLSYMHLSEKNLHLTAVLNQLELINGNLKEKHFKYFFNEHCVCECMHNFIHKILAWIEADSGM